MKTKMGYKYNLEIEVLTPVSIGSDSASTLSPLADYWTHDNTAYMVDHKKLEQALIAKPDILPLYIEAINDAANVKKNGFLYDFIKGKLKDEPKNYISRKIPIIGKGNAVNLRTCIRERGQFLIPGSTIKGAVKSAMLYNWLMRDEHEDDMIDLLNDLEMLYDDSEKELSKEELSKEEVRIKTNIDNFLYRFLEKMNKEKRPNFSLIKVTDAYLENASPAWIHTLRYPLKYKKDETGNRNKKEEQTDIPIFLEAIQVGGKSSFSIDFEETVKIKNENPHLTKYFNENGIYELFKDINLYSIANLEYEQRCVERKNELSSYLNELEALKEHVSQAEKNTAFIPLGFGKTNFYQSIGLALYNWINNLKEGEDVLNFAFESYLQLFSIGKKGQKRLPTTRTLITVNQQPLGWVKLTIKE